MTNCLTARGHVAVTGELKVRYRKSVVIGEEILVRAWIVRSHAPLYLLEAELKQEGYIWATASAKFIERNGKHSSSYHTGRE